ncbi:MAG: glutamate 5-kinase [Oscillospiraceae bacterium]|nr:glutamate 5-kinase [Oscillospiraceae bacterium]
MRNRVVVKVGTSTLTHPAGRLDLKRMDELCRVLADLIHAGREVVLVSSGAISVGTAKLRLDKRPPDTRRRQAVAAVGQCELMHIYDKFFGEYGLPVAQMLLTRDAIATPERYLHARNALLSIIEYGAIPVINENDSVAVDELEGDAFGDNDTLSAYVARLCDAERLVILSDVDGFYDGDPSSPGASRIPIVREITDGLRAAAGGSVSRHGTGGMITKLQAAAVAMDAGIPMALAKGDRLSALYMLASCEPGAPDSGCTWFLSP